METILIRLYCGISIENKCGKQLHPLNEVVKAQKMLSLNKSLDLYSNSPDFVLSIVHLCKEKKMNYELFLDDESVGDNIDAIFESFNKSFSLLTELCPSLI